MSNFTKTVKKGTLWSIIIAVLLVAAVALGIVFGFNTDASMKDAKTLSVSMNKFAYNTQLETVEELCEKEFGALDLAYEKSGEMSGDESEIVYVFAADAELDEVEKKLEAVFATQTAAGGSLEGSFITVTVGTEKVSSVLAKGVVLRGIIACAVIAVVAFVYVALRYKLAMGIVAAISVAVSVALTAAIVMITRIPVTASLVYVLAVSALLTIVTVLMTFNKIRVAAKSEENSELSAAELIGSNVATKEVGTLSAFTCIALVVIGAASAIVSLIGMGAISSVLWFALQSVVAVLVSAFMGLVYAPALYVPFKNSEDKKNEGRTKTDYQGARKTSTKVKKVFEKKVEPKKEVAPVVEEPVEEETVAEPVVEEVEEVEVEETTEEVVEETEAEETAEEVVEEETTEEEVETVAEENND